MIDYKDISTIQTCYTSVSTNFSWYLESSTGFLYFATDFPTSIPLQFHYFSTTMFSSSCTGSQFRAWGAWWFVSTRIVLDGLSCNENLWTLNVEHWTILDVFLPSSPGYNYLHSIFDRQLETLKLDVFWIWVIFC